MSVIEITEYVWIHIVDGKIYAVRPDTTPALMELKLGDGFQTALENLQVSEWRLSTGQTIPTSGEAEIELQRHSQRHREYEPPTGRVAPVPVDGDGTFVEQVKRIQRRYEVNGWSLHEVFTTPNSGGWMIFTKPEGTPDDQPFAEPNLQD